MKQITPLPQNWRDAAGYRKNPLLSEADLGCPGARVQLVEMDPGATIAPHYHRTSHEVYYVMQGECRLRINQETHHLQPGDMLLIEPGDLHQLETIGNTPFRLLVFKTNASTADTFWPNLADASSG